MRAEYARGTPTQSHISPRILVQEDRQGVRSRANMAHIRKSRPDSGLDSNARLWPGLSGKRA